jgi:hypothetical protein
LVDNCGELPGVDFALESAGLLVDEMPVRIFRVCGEKWI